MTKKLKGAAPRERGRERRARARAKAEVVAKIGRAKVVAKIGRAKARRARIGLAKVVAKIGRARVRRAKAIAKVGRAKVVARLRRARRRGRGEALRRALLARFLLTADIVESKTIVIDATPAATYKALRNVDFADVRSPLLRGLFALSMRAIRRARQRRGLAPLPAQMKFTFDNLRKLGRVILVDRPGVEIIVGAIERPMDVESLLERRTPAEFTEFECPGFFKGVAVFRLTRHGARQTLLTYEARMSATDTQTRRRLFALDRFTAPLTRFAMRRVLELVKLNAELACSERQERPRRRTR